MRLDAGGAARRRRCDPTQTTQAVADDTDWTTRRERRYPARATLPDASDAT
ncbi:hypothetical protein [Halobaculum sp. MBLA0143]|uniref:hypothetical protein n=1 Tax=Halobaculum sp. MBLA0143 TaxID=3079933 RepID=UPI0035249AC5